MSDFYSEMHHRFRQNRFRQGLRPEPPAPRLPSWNKRDLLLREWRGLGKGKRVGKGSEGRERKKGKEGGREGNGGEAGEGRGR